MNWLRLLTPVLGPAMPYIAGGLYVAWISWQAAGLWYGWQIDKITLSLAEKKEQAYQLGHAHSTAYQAEIARQRNLINNLDRMLKYEIDKHYAGCAVNDDIVRLWRQTFTATGSASPR